VFAFVKCFDETRADDDNENYYMEREWRVLGDVAFSLEDVSRVILPEEFAKRCRADVLGYYKQVTFISDRVQPAIPPCGSFHENARR
jgi:hypothetical protein